MVVVTEVLQVAMVDDTVGIGNITLYWSKVYDCGLLFDYVDRIIMAIEII